MKFILEKCIILWIIFIGGISVLALEGRVDYADNIIDYTRLNYVEILNYGNQNLKSRNYENALLYYNIATKINPQNPKPYIRLGEIYGYINQYDLAKKNFYIALNLESRNAEASYYFANFFYDNKQYQKALVYYLKAYKYGYENKYEANIRLGEVYEKLADLERAKNYYKHAFRLNRENKFLLDKINSLEDTKYYKSQYYLNRK